MEVFGYAAVLHSHEEKTECRLSNITLLLQSFSLCNWETGIILRIKLSQWNRQYLYLSWFHILLAKLLNEENQQHPSESLVLFLYNLYSSKLCTIWLLLRLHPSLILCTFTLVSWSWGTSLQLGGRDTIMKLVCRRSAQGNIPLSVQWL